MQLGVYIKKNHDWYLFCPSKKPELNRWDRPFFFGVNVVRINDIIPFKHDTIKILDPMIARQMYKRTGNRMHKILN